MLALDVKLLTNKLQKQSLDEGPPAGTTPSNIKLINSDVGLKLSESAQAKLGAATSGNKVWTMSLNAEAAKSSGNSGQFTVPQSQTGFKLTGVKPQCGHKKLVLACSHCESLLASHQISTERPKKRHCRSICVPQETEINIPPAKSTWQPQGSGLWKPVAMTNVRNCSRAGLDGKFDVRTVRWSPTEYRSYEFSSLAPTLQRHIETGHITPDDLLTPPESPVPRPNSVYSDGAISPFTGEYYVDYSFNRMQHMQEFRNRSLSVEDRISFAAQTLTGPPGSGSLSSVPGLNNSVPSSPHHRYRVPRCRSQPTFYDRKSGRRRRRDLRPTLNFHKMTETAYGLSRRSDCLNVPSKERQGSRFRTELENAMSLTTIASSPRDVDMLPHSNFERRLGNSPMHELEAHIRDTVNITEEEEVVGHCGPVKLLGDQEEDENDMEVFQLTEELDLEQIENH